MLHFNAVFEHKKLEFMETEWEGILDNVELPEAFIQQVESHDVEWYSPVIAGIVCVETKGSINEYHVGKNKISQQRFSREPLKGLNKVYIPLNRIVDIMQQHQLRSRMDGNEIIETDLAIMLEDLRKLRSLLEVRRKLRKDNKHTGCWLIYGELDNRRHYLIVYDGIDHTTKDDEIYTQLKMMYSESYLNLLQQKAESEPKSGNRP